MSGLSLEGGEVEEEEKEEGRNGRERERESEEGGEGDKRYMIGRRKVGSLQLIQMHEILDDEFLPSQKLLQFVIFEVALN